MNPCVRCALGACALVAACVAAASEAPKPAGTTEYAYEPVIGMPGKDVVWVPTPPQVVELMLDVAKVTPQDFVIDLGSGDGRIVIAAGKLVLGSDPLVYAGATALVGTGVWNAWPRGRSAPACTACHPEEAMS